MMDGVVDMDTGSNRPLLQMNVESIAEVKVLTSGYQAEYGRSSGVQITAVTKSGTNQFRGSVYDVQRDSDWNSNSKVNKLNGDPKTVLNEKDLGLLDRRPDRQAGRHQQAVLLLQPGVLAAHRRQRRPALPGADRRSSGPAISRSTLDKTARSYNFIKDPLPAGRRAAPPRPSGCFADGGVLGRIPANRLYQTGLNILKLYPLPNISVAGAATTTTRSPGPRRACSARSRRSASTTSRPRSCARRSSTPGGFSSATRFPACSPGSTTRRCSGRSISTLAISGNYSLSTTTVPRGHVRARAGTSWPAARSAQSGHRPDLLPRGGADERQLEPLQRRASAACRCCSRTPTSSNPDYYAKKALDGMNPAPPAWVNGDFVKTPAFAWGSRISRTPPPNIPFPTYFNINATQDVAISLTKVTGRHTLKTGFFNTHSYKAEQATGADAFGTLNFQQDAVGTNAFDTSFGFANAAIGVVQLVPAGARSTSRATSSTTTARPTSRTTGRPATA